ncbi:MAG TPA: TRAP transporter small permease subunit [Gammaproteobacteria bacterium]|nr:TRAP transporter small permease subunit [Gammaproteobacteria bacterium]
MNNRRLHTHLEALVTRLDRIAEITGRSIAWLTLGMVLITFAVVVLRYGLQIGSIALQESVTYLHALVFMLGAAYTLKHDGHVRVDIFYQKASPRTRAWTNLLGTLLLLFPTCIFIFVSSLDYVAAAWSIQEGSRETGGLDGVFLLKTLIPLMALLLLLQGCSLALRSALVIGCRQDPSAGDATEKAP